MSMKTIVQIIIAAALLNPVLAHAGKGGTCIKNGAEIRRHNQMACEKPGDGARWVGSGSSADAEKPATKNSNAAQASRTESQSYEQRNSKKRAATSPSKP
jgi:hypothetical protein